MQDRACQTLVELRVGLARIELATHYLAVGPCQVEHAVGEMAVAVFFYKRQASIATVTDARYEVDDRSLVRFEHDAHADRNNRIEHRAIGVRQRGDIQRLRVRKVATAPDEARAVGFVGNRLDIRAMHGDQVEHPR